MKLFFDQNISHRILNLLSEEFLHSTSVKKENLIDSSDKALWDFAIKSEHIPIVLLTLV